MIMDTLKQMVTYPILTAFDIQIVSKRICKINLHGLIYVIDIVRNYAPLPIKRKKHKRKGKLQLKRFAELPIKLVLLLIRDKEIQEKLVQNSNDQKLVVLTLFISFSFIFSLVLRFVSTQLLLCHVRQQLFLILLNIVYQIANII